MKKISLSEILEGNCIMSLATSYNNEVTVRDVSCVIVNDHIYFQTFKSSTKVQQIMNNSKVALCKDNIQINGECKIIGSLYDNTKVAQKYKECYESAYAKYRNLSDECLCEVEVKNIKMWTKKKGHTYIEKYDLANNKYEERVVI